jgi:membrane protein required for colicin V production
MNTFAFTTVDFIVIGVIVISAIVGLVRGFVREALSLIGFGLAMYLAYRYAGVVANQWLSSMPGGRTGQIVLGFFALFVGILIISKIISGMFNRVITTVGLSFIDRLLGAFFGVLRGVLIIVILSTLLTLTDIPKSSEYKDALTRPGLEFAVGFIRGWLPDDWANQLKEATDIRKVP